MAWLFASRALVVLPHLILLPWLQCMTVINWPYNLVIDRAVRRQIDIPNPHLGHTLNTGSTMFVRWSYFKTGTRNHPRRVYCMGNFLSKIIVPKTNKPIFWTIKKTFLEYCFFYQKWTLQYLKLLTNYRIADEYYDQQSCNLIYDTCMWT